MIGGQEVLLWDLVCGRSAVYRLNSCPIVPCPLRSHSTAWHDRAPESWGSLHSL